MAVNINAPIKSGAMDSNYNLLPDLNIYYGPYYSKSEAISSITTLCGDNAVPLGVKFAVVSNGALTEYQYKTGDFNTTNCIEVGAGGDSYDADITRIDGEIDTLSEKVDSLDGLSVDKVNSIISILGKQFLMIEIRDEDTPPSDNTSALCGTALCGFAICGTN